MNVDVPSYVIVGRGRWANVIRGVLSETSRPVRMLGELRRRNAEYDESYRSRICADLVASGAQVAWVCVPPCSDLLLLVESAILAGLHVVVEKPWLRSRNQTESLLNLAQNHHVQIAIHFQYCFLEEVESLRSLLESASKIRFSGSFTLSRPNRLGIPALHNLGSHLFAIREYAVPNSEVVAIRCGYQMEEDRHVQIATDMASVDKIDLKTHQPLIPRFVANFEHAISRLDFPLDLEFATRVFSAVNSYSESQFADSDSFLIN